MSSRQRRQRRGTVLILFVMMLFVFLGFCALIIDLGMARVGHRQMKSASDAAALEGLRFRDDIPVAWRDEATAPPEMLEVTGPLPELPYDPSQSDWQEFINKARRWAARNAVTETFADYVEPDSDVTMQYGAGASIDLVADPGSVPEMRASMRLDVRDDRFYKPTLELNLDDEAHGDLIQGEFTRTSTSPHDLDYARPDFDSAGDPNAFLARVRRTQEGEDDEHNRVPGVSSSGRQMNFLFSPGVRLNLGATSIANAQPAKAVGAPFIAAQHAPTSPPANDRMGATPFAVRSDWTPTEYPLTVVLKANQSNTESDPDVARLYLVDVDSNPEVPVDVGVVICHGGEHFVNGQGRPISLGSIVMSEKDPNLPGSESELENLPQSFRNSVFTNTAVFHDAQYGFVPVVENLTAATSGATLDARILGFRLVKIVPYEDPTQTKFVLTFSNIISVASENITGVFSTKLDAASDMSAIFTRHEALRDVLLHCPVLVR